MARLESCERGLESCEQELESCERWLETCERELEFCVRQPLFRERCFALEPSVLAVCRKVSTPYNPMLYNPGFNPSFCNNPLGSNPGWNP